MEGKLFKTLKNKISSPINNKGHKHKDKHKHNKGKSCLIQIQT